MMLFPLKHKKERDILKKICTRKYILKYKNYIKEGILFRLYFSGLI